MNYIDMHCDTLAKAWLGGEKTAKRLQGTMVDVERLRKGGAKAQFFAMFLPQKREDGWFLPEQEGGRFSMEQLGQAIEGMYRVYCDTMEACKDTIAPACCYADFQKNWSEGKISAFLTIENGHPVSGKIENIERFYGMGVRLITLIWNDANCLGYPHSADQKEMERGLTKFGREAVAYMETRGILVDVSHLSDGGFYEVADIVKGPFVASHSNCRALAPATRNLTDEMIRVLAEHGGVAGLNFAPDFLNGNEGDKVSRIERMCDHVGHLIRVGGAECAAIGTDFDGIEGQFEISDCTGMELLFHALRRRGLSGDTLEGLAWRNAARVIREAVK